MEKVKPKLTQIALNIVARKINGQKRWRNEDTNTRTSTCIRWNPNRVISAQRFVILNSFIEFGRASLPFPCCVFFYCVFVGQRQNTNCPFQCGCRSDSPFVVRHSHGFDSCVFCSFRFFVFLFLCSFRCVFCVFVLFIHRLLFSVFISSMIDWRFLVSKHCVRHVFVLVHFCLWSSSLIFIEYFFFFVSKNKHRLPCVSVAVNLKPRQTKLICSVLFRHICL